MTFYAAGPSGADLALIVCAVIVAISVLASSLSKYSRRTATLAALAKRFGGVVVESAWGNDRVSFAVDGVQAELTYDAGNRNRSPYTMLRFQHVPPGVLRLIPDGVYASLRRIFGTQDLKTGDAAFDRVFFVQGCPEDWVRTVLGPETRHQLTELASLGTSMWREGEASLDAGRTGVTIRVDRNLLDDGRRIEAFMGQAIAVFKALRTQGGRAVTVISVEQQGATGSCPVCANPLDTESRRCPGCGTLHHSDCWDYFGGCAIYACTQRGSPKA